MNKQSSPATGVDQDLLSLLADGEVSPGDVRLACDQWRDDPAARRQWHAYHLIGDALRSSELCGQGQDAAFVNKLRARLADEPPLLAPTPGRGDLRDTALPSDAGTPARSRRRMRRWAGPLGMAAGVALVASATWISRPGSSSMDQLTARADPPSSAMAPLTPAATTVVAAGAGSVAKTPIPTEFEPYLAAHRQFQYTQTLGPASGYLRTARYDNTQR